MTTGIHQEIVFDATSATVYATLMDAAQFSRMIGGAPAAIDAAPGGAFSCFGGMIVGRNVECEPGQRLVQAWRVKSWQPGVYSVARSSSGTRVHPRVSYWITRAFPLNSRRTSNKAGIRITGIPSESCWRDY